MNPLASRLLSTTDWSRLRVLTGSADDVPLALRELADSGGEEDSRKAYWRLDNHVVVQGQLFPAAIAVIPILLAILVGHLSHWATIRTLDLLLQIAGGSTDVSERGLDRDLGLEAREACFPAIWNFYGLALDNDRRLAETALELAVTVDPDQSRRAAVLSALAHHESPVKSFAQELLVE